MNKSEKSKIIWYFIGIVVLVFVVLFFALSISGLAPERFQINLFERSIEINSLGTEYDYADGTRPDRITIDKIGVDSFIEQPESREVAVLDSFLEKGVVHYPGSGTIEDGNIFLFGHSADRFNFVTKEAYKAFNGLSNLDRGDEIELEADGKVYVYKVTDVVLVTADTALVQFDNSGRTLTLSTCNTFGHTQERWVVEAEFHRSI